MIEAGTILQDRYRIEKQIGQGGMGAVFVATDQRFGSTVAIKETFFDDEKLQKAFEREARLLNSLKHSALPKVIDYFAEDGGQFIVMEFIAGDDLSETMEKLDDPFPFENVLNWADQLCDALKYLHDQEMPVIHRDIKPQNLKLTPDGQVILLDFGLAKGNPTDASHKTAAKSIFGYSRSYASLEQIQGTGTDPRSDLYSLAATLYHLMTGIPPADALTRAMNVLNGQPDPLVPANFLNQGIPNAVAQVLQRSMALNAGERPESAIELKLLLESADKTTGTSDTVRATVAAASTELLSQQTKLMPGTTHATAESRMDLSTEVSPEDLPDGSGEVTSAATRQTAFVFGRARRPLYVGAAALGGFLVIGGMAFYATRHSGTETAPTDIRQSMDPSVPAAPSSDANSAQVSGAPSDPSELDPQKPASQIGSDAKGDARPLPDQSKQPNDPGAQTAAPPGGNPESFDSIVVDEGSDVRVNGGQIETDAMIIDENGVRWKDPSKDPRNNVPGRMPIPPEELRKLTPKQRQKIREWAKRQEQLKNIEMPSPQVPKPPANN